MNRSLTPLESSELYLGQLDAEGYIRPATLETYRVHLRVFLRECPNLPDDVREMEARHLIAWTNVLRSRGLKPGAIRAYQASVWVWCSWLFREHYLPVDISRQIRRFRPDESTVTRRTATPDIIDKLLKCARARSEHRERNTALILTLVATGARRSELAACHLEDYDKDSGTLWLMRHTKTGHPRLVGISVEARYALDRYILTERGKTPGALFLARQRRPLTADAIHCVLRSLATSAAVEATAHDFRRACAARLLEAGATPWTVQHQLGHRTDVLTKRYAHEARERSALAEYAAIDSGVRILSRKRA